MIEMNLSKIRIDEKRGEQVIVLKEVNGNRLLPIVIGIMEATAIKMKVSNFQPPRPLTHDLLHSVIDHMGGTLERVVVAKLEGNVFYARLALTRPDGPPLDVDARPSDAIALALRAECPIFVSEEILDQVGAQAGE